MAFTTWDTVQKVNVTLTGSNLIATGSGVGSVRAADTQSTGKFYFEVTIGGTFANANSAIGLCTGNVVLGTTTVTGSSCIVFRKGGSVVIDGASTQTIATYTTASLIGIAVDLTNKLIWFRVGAAGNWNNNASNSPTTGVGGISFSTFVPTYQVDFYPFAVFGATNDALTANFGATGFTGALPSGYTSGWTTGTTAVKSLVATQVGAEAWVTQSTSEFRATQVGSEAWLDISSIVASPIGVSSTSAIGTPTVSIPSLGTNVPITGLAATTAIGTPTVTIIPDTLVSLTGLEATSAIGIPIANVNVTVTLTGLAATAAIGTATAAVISNATFSLVGLFASPNIGVPSGKVEFTLPTGVSATTAVGTPTTYVVLFSGQQANAQIGIPHSSLETDILISGLASASVGGILTISTTGINVAIAGVQASTQIGTLSVQITIALTGVEATAAITQPSVVIYRSEMAFDDLRITEQPRFAQELIDELSVRWSDTDGQSWQMPVARSFGRTGDYNKSLQYQRLGMSRRARVFELSWSSQAPTALMGASIKWSDTQT